MRTTTVQKNQSTKSRTGFAKMIGSSTRLTLTYIVFVVWVSLAVFAILVDADLYSLATYFASGLPLILGYLWSETSRPSLTDAAEIVKSIGTKTTTTGNSNGNNYSAVSSVNSVSSLNGDNRSTTTYQQYNQSEQEPDTNILTIYSDDASVELKVTQKQLSTLMNTGYVDTVGDKYTFKASLLDQLKSLINDNSQDPTI